LEGVLNAHAFVIVERPPELWSTEVELEPFVRLLGEMLSLGLVRNGQDLSSITLNVSNVTVAAEPDSEVPSGDFVAVTVRCSGEWSPEATWVPDAAVRGRFVSDEFEIALDAAEAAYAYVRVLEDMCGSVTSFLRRKRGL